MHRVRDHGGLLFIDLRDHYGLTQIVADPDSPAFSTAERVRAEWCIRVDGAVRHRPPETVNPNLPTGAIEIFAREIEVLSEAPELPLPVFGEPDYPEDMRLKYRFLDLRRESLHRNIMRRVAIVAKMRELMRAAGFNEFQTPILTASSPEGARDFLVPSRLHPGKFYALPQAPQQFKQLIMMAGFDRYFQIAPCFRDEDPRADRLPGEFYQLDVEMSFVTQDDVFAAMEPVLRGVFEAFADGKSVTQDFPRIPYREAMRKYGTDKPDLRNPIEMQEVTEHFAGSGFKVFAGMIERDQSVRGLGDPGAGRRQPRLLRPHEFLGAAAGPAGARLHLLPPGEAEGAGPIAKNIGPERTAAIRDAAQPRRRATPCSSLLATRPISLSFAGAARTKIGQELGLVDENAFALAWIVDFPMFEWNEEEKKIDFSHNPFSMPQGGLEALGDARSAGHPREPVPTSSATATRSRRAPSATTSRDHAEGLRHRRLRRQHPGGAVRRHAARAAVRRAAAWRHGGRARPHRDAPLRRAEPPRDHHVPDEPAGARTCSWARRRRSRRSSSASCTSASSTTE